MCFMNGEKIRELFTSLGQGLTALFRASEENFQGRLEPPDGPCLETARQGPPGTWKLAETMLCSPGKEHAQGRERRQWNDQKTA